LAFGPRLPSSVNCSPQTGHVRNVVDLTNGAP
jgi:hypothetical protein